MAPWIFSGCEALRDYLLSRPCGDLSSLDFESITPSSTTLKVGAQVGVDLAPNAFSVAPISLEADPVESKEEGPKVV